LTGVQVPSEHELVAEYGVARGTARQAIVLLRNEGLIEAVPRWLVACSSRETPARRDFSPRVV
jgi:DNA-binding FadR family transcriptional regulator